jgi:hypothetical protein
MKKIKCWVVYDDNYPGGMIFRDRRDALENSAEIRNEGYKACTIIKYFTEEELSELKEAD